MSVKPLDTIMSPSSVAIVGASNNFVKMGTIQMLNLVNCGFPGDIMPVHPKEKTVLGKKAYPSIKDLPYAPDLAIFVVPTRLVPEMLDDFGKLGTKRAVVITAGFRETGGEGRDLERRIIDIARAYGIRFLGPNCLGIVNTNLPLNITVAPILVHGGSFSLASQSGTYIAQSVKFLQKNGIGFAKAVSVGNEADISLTDCLEYLGDDDDTKAIGLYIEGIRDAARFLEVARRVSGKKPIVAQYVGGTEAGARSGSSHTGAMAGPDFIYDGLFAQAGIIRVDTIEEVYRIGWALATQPPLKGARIAVLTNSGGPGTAIASTCNAADLEIPEFPPGIQERIGELIPGHASARNPVDLTFHMDMDTLAEKIPEILFQAQEIDGIIIHGIMDTGFMELMYPVARDYIPVSKEEFLKASQVRLDKLVRMPHTYGKPLLISSFFGEEDHAVDEFHRNRIPTFDSPEKAAKAMAVFYKHFLIRRRGSSGRAVRPESAALPEAQEILAGWEASTLDEYTAKRVLKAYGIPTPREMLTRSPEEAAAAAGEIGFPVAVKACSPSISHKTERNLVFLNVKDEEGVMQACASILSAEPEAGILVAEMLRGKRELMAGISTHAGFPPCVMFGIGGVFAEAHRDFTIRLAPLSTGDALEMMDSIRARALMGPYRSMEEVDRDALARILVGLGDLALDFPCIKEIDLNPIIIEEGGPKVADALMVVR